MSVKFDPSISRDGSKLAFLAFGGFQSTRFEVRLRDMLTGREKSFPSSALHFDQTPRISPDGAILSYQDFISGKLRTFLVSRDTASGRELCESCPILGFFTNPNFAVVQSGPHELERIDLSSQQRFPILEVSAGQIADAVVSPDDRWLCFLIGESNGRAAIYVAPLGKRTASEKDWVLVAEDIRFLGSPQWSPNGNLLYYLSERDGHCCIWAQRLDPAGKKPIGEAIGVYHAHKSRFNLNVTGDGVVRVATDKLVFLMSEMSATSIRLSQKTLGLFFGLTVLQEL